MTQKIVNEYSADLYNKEWNVNAINDRWLWFCEQVEVILDLNLDDNKQDVLA